MAKGIRCTIARVGKYVKTPHSLHTLSMNANGCCHCGNARAVLSTSHLEIWCQCDALCLTLSKGTENRCQHKDFNADVRVTISLIPQELRNGKLQISSKQYTSTQTVTWLCSATLSDHIALLTPDSCSHTSYMK